MQEVVIIADTVTDFTAEMAQELGVILSPVHVIIDDVDYRDRFDISPEEFSYLLTSFTAGGIYYRIKNARPDVPYQKGTYRYNMLKASKTRKAWPILQKFIEPSPYRDKLEVTLKTIEEENQQGKNIEHIEKD